MATVKFISVPTKRLSASINASSTSIQVSDILGWDGVALTASDFGTKMYCVLRNDNNTLMEIMELDPSTIAAGSITILLRGLKFNGDLTTEVTANKLTWVKNETLVELGTDVPQLLEHTIRDIGDQSVAGVKTFSDFPKKSGTTTPTGADEFATKAYVDTQVGGTSIYDQNLISATAGETLAAGNLTYFKESDQRWWKTDADAIATASKHIRLGIAQGTATAGNSVNILLAGLEKNLTGLTAGAKYFVSGTAGSVTTTPGAIARFVGWAMSTTRLIFAPEGLPENLYFDVLGETLSAADIVYFKTSDQKWWKTDADAAATAIGVRIGVVEIGGSADAVGLIRTGGVDATHTGLTAGATYFLSGTAAALSATAGAFQRVYGVALSTSEILMTIEAGTTVTQSGEQIYAVDAVGTDAYAITLVPAITAYKDGLTLRFKAGTANTGAATLAVNGLTATTIKKAYNSDLVTGDILAGQIVTVTYDATNSVFQLLSDTAASAGFSQAIDGSSAVSVSSSGTSFTTDDSGVVTLVLPKAQKVMLLFSGYETSRSSNAQTQTFDVRFNVDAGTTIIVGYSTSVQTQSNTDMNASCSAVTASLTAGSHTFRMRIVGSSSSSMSRGITGILYAVAIN